MNEKEILARIKAKKEANKVQKNETSMGTTESSLRVKKDKAESGKFITKWEIKKYASDEDRENKIVYSKEEALKLFGTEQTCEFSPNLLLPEGITAIWTLACSTGATKFDNANAYLGVGDSSTAESASQTGLQASTNKLYKAMDATYPQISGTSVIFRSTFTANEANFSWNEFTVANGNSDSAVNMNRKVSAQGAKVSGQSWEFTLTITIA